MTRAAFFRLHSWLGIVTGAVHAGRSPGAASLVVFNDEIEWLLNPAVRADPALGVRPLDEVAAAIRARHPDRRFAVHLADRAALGPHRVRLRGPDAALPAD